MNWLPKCALILTKYSDKQMRKEINEIISSLLKAPILIGALDANPNVN